MTGGYDPYTFFAIFILGPCVIPVIVLLVWYYVARKYCKRRRIRHQVRYRL